MNVAVKVAVDDSMIGGAGCAGYADVYKDTQLPSMLDIDIHITAFEINLSNDQYRDLLNCLAFFSNYSTISRNRKYRPKRISVKENPSLWWKYAYQVTIADIREKKKQSNWKSLIEHSTKRRNYIDLQKRRDARYAKATGMLQLKYDSPALQSLNDLEELFSLSDIIDRRKCAEMEVTTELAEIKLKEEKMQSDSKEVDDSYVGWITSWWSDENSHADNHDGTSGKDTSMEGGDFSISEKEKNDFFKVYGQNSEDAKKRDKLIELMTMGAKNRSSVTGSFELERITFTLGNTHAKTEESVKHGIMQLDLIILTAHGNSFNQTTRITSKIADLRMKDLSSKSTAENKEIIKQTPTAISNDEVTQLPNDDQNNGLLHVTYDILHQCDR